MRIRRQARPPPRSTVISKRTRPLHVEAPSFHSHAASERVLTYCQLWSSLFRLIECLRHDPCRHSHQSCPGASPMKRVPCVDRTFGVNVPTVIVVAAIVLLSANVACAQDNAGWTGNMAVNPGFEEDWVNATAEGHVLSFKGDW